MFTLAEELRADYATSLLPPKIDLAELQQLFGGTIKFGRSPIAGDTRTRTQTLDAGNISIINSSHAPRFHLGLARDQDSTILATGADGIDLTTLCAYAAKLPTQSTLSCPVVRKPHGADDTLPEALFHNYPTSIFQEPFGIEDLKIESRNASNHSAAIDPTGNYSKYFGVTSPSQFIGNLIVGTRHRIHELPESVALQVQALGHFGVQNSDVYELFGTESAEQLAAVWRRAMNQTAPQAAAMCVRQSLA